MVSTDDNSLDSVTDKRFNYSTVSTEDVAAKHDPTF